MSLHEGGWAWEGWSLELTGRPLRPFKARAPRRWVKPALAVLGLALLSGGALWATQTEPVGAAIAPEEWTQDFDPQVVARAKRATVHITVDGGRVGAGVVISDEVLVATNAHVVDGADTVTVQFFDHKTRLGQVVARDAYLDLALVSVKPIGADYAVSTLGAGAKMSAEQPIFAVGSPAGLDFTVSRGTVGRVDRQIGGLPWIQMDIAVNPGNSGGGVFDQRGRLVGLTTLKSAEVEGVGMALHIERLREGDDALLADHMGTQDFDSDYLKLVEDAAKEAGEVEFPLVDFGQPVKRYLASARSARIEFPVIQITPPAAMRHEAFAELLVGHSSLRIEGTGCERVRALEGPQVAHLVKQAGRSNLDLWACRFHCTYTGLVRAAGKSAGRITVRIRAWDRESPPMVLQLGRGR